MKVLHLTSGNLFGGIETMLVSIARHAGSEPGLDTQFAVCFDGRFRNELEASGAAVHCLGAVRARNPFGVRRARRVLERILDLEEIDVVICHSSWPLAIFGAAVKSSGRRLVLWQHAPNGGASWLEGWARQSRPELVIFNSEYTARTAKGIHASARRAVLHCPVTLHAVSDHLSASERASVRADFDTRPDDVVIVTSSPAPGCADLAAALPVQRDQLIDHAGVGVLVEVHDLDVRGFALVRPGPHVSGDLVVHQRGQGTQ